MSRKKDLPPPVTLPTVSTWPGTRPPNMMSVMYGMPPSDGPRMPDFPPPGFPNAPFPGRTFPGTTIPAIPEPRALIPCSECKRHIVSGTECPFCAAAAMVAAAKAPNRKAVESILAECTRARNELEHSIQSAGAVLSILDSVIAGLKKI